MERIFLGAVAVSIIVVLRFIFVPVDSTLGLLMTYGSVIGFFLLCARWAFKQGTE